MNTIQRAGAYASFIIGLLFIADVVVVLGLLAPLGVTGLDTPPDQVLAAASKSTTPFQVGNLIVASFSISLMLVSLAVRERLSASAPNRMRLAVIAASISSSLFIAGGIIAFTTFSHIVTAGDASAFLALGMVVSGLLNAAIFSFGWMALLWGWAGLSTKGLPVGLSYVFLLDGVIAVLVFIIPILNLLSVILNIIWAFWLGLVLLRPAPMMAARGMSPS